MHTTPSSAPVRSARLKRARDALRSATSRNYTTARIWGALSARKRTFGVQPVLAYQMGKVGSTAVEASLAAAGERVLKVHLLTDAGIARRADFYRRNWPDAGSGRHLWDSMWAQRLLGRRNVGQARVITLVREPVARNLSGFFEVGETYHGVPFREMTSDPNETDLVERLNEAFLHGYDDHDKPATWFDDELHAVFGIDVYEHPFPTEEGWQLLENDRAKVVVIRNEDLGRVLPEATEALLGRRIPVVAANVGDDKDHARLYRLLRKRIQLPPSYLERMYDSRYAQHFYSEPELAGFRDHWARTG